MSFLQNDFPYSRNQDSDLRQILEMYFALRDLPRQWQAYQDLINGKFEDLYEFVRDYFKNLDVQEEINKKLEEMLKDGSLLALLTRLPDLNDAPVLYPIMRVQSGTSSAIAAQSHIYYEKDGVDYLCVAFATGDQTTVNFYRLDTNVLVSSTSGQYGHFGDMAKVGRIIYGVWGTGKQTTLSMFDATTFGYIGSTEIEDLIIGIEYDELSDTVYILNFNNDIVLYRQNPYLGLSKLNITIPLTEGINEIRQSMYADEFYFYIVCQQNVVLAYSKSGVFHKKIVHTQYAEAETISKYKGQTTLLTNTISSGIIARMYMYDEQALYDMDFLQAQYGNVNNRLAQMSYYFDSGNATIVQDGTEDHPFTTYAQFLLAAKRADARYNLYVSGNITDNFYTRGSSALEIRVIRNATGATITAMQAYSGARWRAQNMIINNTGGSSVIVDSNSTMVLEGCTLNGGGGIGCNVYEGGTLMLTGTTTFNNCNIGIQGSTGGRVSINGQCNFSNVTTQIRFNGAFFTQSTASQNLWVPFTYGHLPNLNDMYLNPAGTWDLNNMYLPRTYLFGNIPYANVSNYPPQLPTTLDYMSGSLVVYRGANSQTTVQIYYDNANTGGSQGLSYYIRYCYGSGTSTPTSTPWYTVNLQS